MLNMLQRGKITGIQSIQPCYGSMDNNGKPNNATCEGIYGAEVVIKEKHEKLFKVNIYTKYFYQIEDA